MKKLFQVTKLKNIDIMNRFIRSAICEKLADDKGHIMPNYKKYYEKLAEGEVGIIITGYTTVFSYDKPSINMTAIYDDTFIYENEEVVKAIHQKGSRVISQIVLGNEYIYDKDNFKSYNFTDEFKNEYINDIIQGFVNAAIRVKKAGFDGVQIHCAHGYFLSRTLSPIYNKRTDDYGKNKYKLIEEVYTAVREAVGEDYIVGIKINCRDNEEEGAKFDICYETCMKLDKLDIDFIEISGGDFKEEKYKNQESIYFNEASKIAKDVKAKVALVGLNRKVEELKKIIRETDIEYISMARPFICEPDLVRKFKSGKSKKAMCISCNKCYRDEEGNKCIINKFNY